MRTGSRTSADREGAGPEPVPPPPGPGMPGADRDRIRTGIWYCVKVFLALRIGLFVLALVATALLPPAHVYSRGVNQDVPGPVSVPGWPAHRTTPGIHNVFTAWERFDGLWFLRIATKGYVDGDGSAAFFPLYPLAIRAVSFLIGGHPLAASLVVSNLAFLAALIVLYFLTCSELSEPAARKTILYLSVFPTAFFFLAPYSESLFLLLSVASFWAARRRKWPLAAAFGALAASTRSLGILIAPALALEAVHQWREARQRIETEADGRSPGTEERHDASRGALVARLGWAGSVSLGLLGYLLFWQVAHGDFWAPLTKQGNWERVVSLPWNSLREASRDAFGYLGSYPQGYHQVDWLIVVPVLLAAAYAFVRLRPAYGFYTWGSILVPLSFIFEGRPLMSMPRLLVPLFPVFWGLALLAERRRVAHQLIVAVSAAGLGLLTLLFVDWFYIF
jgi:mannosyltransferase PIG-V